MLLKSELFDLFVVKHHCCRAGLSSVQIHLFEFPICPKQDPKRCHAPPQMGHLRVHRGVGGDLGTALCPQSDRWGKGFGKGLSDAPVHVLLFLRGTWVRVSPFPAATKRVSGARARRGGPREAGNPWGKIPDPCNAAGPCCGQPVLAMGELPPARRSLAEGRIYGLTRGDPTALGPAAPLPPPRAAEGRFLGQA